MFGSKKFKYRIAGKFGEFSPQKRFGEEKSGEWYCELIIIIT